MFYFFRLNRSCQDAIDEFVAIPEKEVPNRSVLNIYGVLQATFCQQDGLYGLYQNISRNKFKNIGDFFSLFKFDYLNREIRNDIVGHPSNRNVNGNPEFYFIDKGPHSKYKFSYAGYTPDFIVKKVDLNKIIDEQKVLAITVLNKIDQMINEKVNQHKENHKNDKLYPILSKLNYSIQLIKRGYSDSQRNFQAEGNLKIVTSKMNEVEEELKNRYKKAVPESIKCTLKNIYYILERIQEWYNNNKLLHNKDAEIFMIAFDTEFKELQDMLKEIDEEYN